MDEVLRAAHELAADFLDGLADRHVAATAEASAVAAALRGSGLPEVGEEVLNQVELNQVLVRFGDSDEVTSDVIRRVQEEGVAWMGGTTWHGMGAMRISVSNWRTTEADADVTVEAILRAASG